jgi:hypothetical protein
MLMNFLKEEDDKLVPVADVLQELIGNEPHGHEHLQLPTGAVDGDPRHGAQDIAVDLWLHGRGANCVVVNVDDVVHHLVARHDHGPPQLGQLRCLEPGAAYEARAHQDLDGAELDEDRHEGVQRQLRPVPGRHRPVACSYRWCIVHSLATPDETTQTIASNSPSSACNPSCDSRTPYLRRRTGEAIIIHHHRTCCQGRRWRALRCDNGRLFVLGGALVYKDEQSRGFSVPSCLMRNSSFPVRIKAPLQGRAQIQMG